MIFFPAERVCVSFVSFQGSTEKSLRSKYCFELHLQTQLYLRFQVQHPLTSSVTTQLKFYLRLQQQQYNVGYLVVQIIAI